MKSSRHPLFHRFLKILKEHDIQNKKILVACSGGIDSLVLLDLLSSTSSLLNLKISVGHVHHGLVKSKKVNDFRNFTQSYVYLIALSLNLPFFTNKVQKSILTSEDDLRKFRYQFLNKWCLASKAHFLTLAHTADDLLETRLMRLIRGTGEEGLTSMKTKEDRKLRPLLTFTKDELQNYAHFRNMTHLEDPSNTETDPFRNWIRQVWLKELKDRSPKSIQKLAASLEKINIALESSIHPFFQVFTPHGLDKEKFMKLKNSDQKRVLAKYMRVLNLQNYQESHIQEVLKFLHKNKHLAHAQLKLIKKIWIIKEKHIKIR